MHKTEMTEDNAKMRSENMKMTKSLSDQMNGLPSLSESTTTKLSVVIASPIVAVDKVDEMFPGVVIQMKDVELEGDQSIESVIKVVGRLRDHP